MSASDIRFSPPHAGPVRVDETGTVTRVGLLLRIGADGAVSRARDAGLGR